MSPRERPVGLVDGPGGELRGESAMRGIVLGHEETSGGVPIETMDEARLSLVADARDLGAVMEEGVYEGS